jgi:hypothetical protein
MRPTFLGLTIAVTLFATPALADTTQPAPAPAATPRSLTGKITERDGNIVTVTVSTLDGKTKDYQLELMDDVRVSVDAARATLKDLAPGMDVAISTLPAAPDRPARQSVQALSPGIDARVTKVDGNTLTVRPDTAPTKAVTITVDEKTRYFNGMATDRGISLFGSGKASLDVIEPDAQVHIVPPDGKAAVIVVARNRTMPGFEATLTKIDGQTLTLTPIRGDRAPVTVALDGKTAISRVTVTLRPSRIPGRPIFTFTPDGPARITDLKEGQCLRVTAADGRATKVEIETRVEATSDAEVPPLPAATETAPAKPRLP